MESKTKGTMILRYSGRFYKVIKVKSRGDNTYTCECKDIDSRESRTPECVKYWFTPRFKLYIEEV